MLFRFFLLFLALLFGGVYRVPSSVVVLDVTPPVTLSFDPPFFFGPLLTFFSSPEVAPRPSSPLNERCASMPRLLRQQQIIPYIRKKALFFEWNSLRARPHSGDDPEHTYPDSGAFNSSRRHFPPARKLMFTRGWVGIGPRKNLHRKSATRHFFVGPSLSLLPLGFSEDPLEQYPKIYFISPW